MLTLFDNWGIINIESKESKKIKIKGETKMKKNLNEVLTVVAEEQWQELYNNLGWTYMEAILNQDGSIEYRMEDNLSRDEYEIVATLPLKTSYWRDSLEEWELYDQENDTVKIDADQEIINDFIEEHLKNAFEER